MLIPHPSIHFAAAAGALVVAAALIVVVRNRLIRRRLLFSAVTALVAALIHLAAVEWPDHDLLKEWADEAEFVIALLAIANVISALVFNPWFRDGESNRAPAIVQDTLVALVVVAGALFAFNVSAASLLAGSTLFGLVIGFALQETLGNAFAGMAIQTERPFRVGHWIAVGDRVGLVTEMTWRATKIRTKAGNQVAVPNSVLAREAINNYSEPTAPTRIQVEVGATYMVPPNDVREAILTAVRGAKFVLESPAPDVLLTDFGASAITYRTRFWVDDFSKDDLAQDAVRTRIYYEFRRRNIEIPWPIQIEYSRDEVVPDPVVEQGRFAAAIAAVPVLAPLPAEAHRALASSAREMLFGDGEVIVREGNAGASMFLVVSGSVAVTVGPDRREVAVTRAGGYFGEMSLLTGDPRTATVSARGDVTVLELTGDAFRDYVQRRPEVIDQIAAAAGTRRKELDEIRAAAGATPVAAGASLRDRMRKYFGLN